MFQPRKKSLHVSTILFLSTLLITFVGIRSQDDYEMVVAHVTAASNDEVRCLPLSVGVYKRIQCTKNLVLLADRAEQGCKNLAIVSNCNKELSEKIDSCHTAKANYFKTLLLLYERTIRYVCGNDGLILKAIFGPATEEEKECSEYANEQCLTRKGNICHVMQAISSDGYFCVCTEAYLLTPGRQRCYLKDDEIEPPDLSRLTYPPDAYPVDDFLAPRPNGSIVCGHTLLHTFRETFERAFFHDLPKPVKNGDFLCTHIPRTMQELMEFRQCNDEIFDLIKNVVKNDAGCFIHWEESLEDSDDYQKHEPSYCRATHGMGCSTTVFMLSFALSLANIALCVSY